MSASVPLSPSLSKSTARRAYRPGMRILLTNDDGIRAPGIIAMYDALVDEEGRFGGPVLDRSPNAVTRSPRSVVFPVAPLTVQSATGHGVTFHQPLLRSDLQLSERMHGVAVDGRPADCVKVAVANIWPERFGEGERPDLLISGMNAGANCGINVIYSGTVAAALEAAFLGVPSIAVSLRLGGGRPRWDIAAGWARRTIDLLLRDGPPGPHECLSINLPLCEDEWPGGRKRSKYDAASYSRGNDPGPPMPPIKVCPMNVHGLVDKYERRVSPAGDVYYWAAGHGLDFRGTDAGSDVEELLNGAITVTPLTFDLTRRDRMAHWAKVVG
jgi:5'-nucleotidase